MKNHWNADIWNEYIFLGIRFCGLKFRTRSYVFVLHDSDFPDYATNCQRFNFSTSVNETTNKTVNHFRVTSDSSTSNYINLWAIPCSFDWICSFYLQDAATQCRWLCVSPSKPRDSPPKENFLQVMTGPIFFKLMQHCKTSRTYRSVDVGTVCKHTRY